MLVKTLNMSETDNWTACFNISTVICHHTVAYSSLNKTDPGQTCGKMKCADAATHEPCMKQYLIINKGLEGVS